MQVGEHYVFKHDHGEDNWVPCHPREVMTQAQPADTLAVCVSAPNPIWIGALAHEFAWQGSHMAQRAAAGIPAPTKSNQRLAILLAMAMFVLVVDTSLMNA